MNQPLAFIALVTAAVAFTGAASRASADTFVRFASSVPEVPNGNWADENEAQGNPGCSSCDCDSTLIPLAYNPSPGKAADDTYLRAADFPDITVPPGHIVTGVWVDVMCRFDTDTTGRIRVRADLGRGDIFADDSEPFVSGETCEFRLGEADGDMGESQAVWTQEAINAIRVRARRLGNDTKLRIKAFRLTVTTAPAPLANDECGGALPIGDGVTSFDTSNATDSASSLPLECTDSISHDVWYVYTASHAGVVTFSTCGGTSSDTVLAVYGGACGSELLACNDDSDGCVSPWASTVSIPVIGGSSYRVRIGGYDGPVSGSLHATSVLAPANNECWSSALISAGSVGFNTAGATPSGPTLPLDCSDGNAGDVWYLYIPSSSGLATFSTCGVGYPDTVLAVYSGSCAGYTLLGCDDDYCGIGGPSTLTLPVQAGLHYTVRLAGYSGAVSGTLAISVATPPANDECSGAPVINTAAVPFDTTDATTSSLSLPAGCADAFGNDVWFRYVATCTGNATFSTCSDTDFDTVLSLYTGPCGSLTPLGCNDDDDVCRSFIPSTLSVPVTSGAEYLVRVGGYDSVVGNGILTVSCQPEPGNPDLDGDGVVGPLDLAVLLGAWGTESPADLDHSGAVSQADLAILLGAWG